MSFNQRPPSVSHGQIPAGHVIASFTEYAQAQRAVDHLSDQHLDVAGLAIVGRDLSSVESVVGRLTYPVVALRGAVQGAFMGLFFGVMLSLLAGSAWGSSVLLTVLLGAAFFMLMNVIGFAAQRGRRDFASVSTFAAARFEIIARPELADDARRALQAAGLAGVDPAAGWGPAQAHGQAPQSDRPGPHGPGAQPPSTPWQGGGPGQHPGGQAQPHPEQGGAPQQQAPRPLLPGQQVVDPPRRGTPERQAELTDLPDGRPQYGVRTEDEAQHERPSDRDRGQEPEQSRQD